MLRIGAVELIQFREARNMSERNHWDIEKGKSIKQKLALSESEEETLQVLKGRKELEFAALVLCQKLIIKQALYEGVNKGEYLSKIDFIVPLKDEVKQWARSFGYALSAKPNTVWITGANGWQYEAIDSPPPSKTEFTLLW